MFENQQGGIPPTQEKGDPPVDDMFATTDPFHRGNRPSPFVPKKPEPLSGTPRSSTPPVIQEIAEAPSSGKKKGVFIFLFVVCNVVCRKCY